MLASCPLINRIDSGVGFFIKVQVKKSIVQVDAIKHYEAKRLKAGGVKMKVLKFSKDINTDNIIFERGLKEGSLEGHVLVTDNNFGESGSKEQVQKAINSIKSTGIKYVIASSFAEEFYKNAVAIGLFLIQCSDSKTINKGDNIEVYLREGLIFNNDTEQECKCKPIQNPEINELLA